MQISMKTIKDKKLIGLFILVVAFYLVDCMFAHKVHSEVSWIASGVYYWHPLGFPLTVGIALYFLWSCLVKLSGGPL